MRNKQRRVPAGVPTGGRFAALVRPEVDISLIDDSDESAQRAGGTESESEAPVLVIGEALKKVSIAQVRRDLAVGRRVQVVYPGQAEGDPDVRTVTEQTSSHMWTGRPGEYGHARLNWAGATADKDASGGITVYREDGSPVATFIPLDDDEPGFTDVQDRNPVAVAIVRARVSDDSAELEELAGRGSMVVRHLVVANRATSTKTLERLAHGADESLARDILKRDFLSRESIQVFADHPAESVRRDVAHHPSTDAGILDVIARRHEECQVLVAENRNASRDTLHWIAGNGTHMARVAVAGNPSTDYQDLDRIASTGSEWAKEAVAGNPTAPEYVLRRLHRDPRAGVGIMAALVRNPAAPKDVVSEIVRSSGDTVVRAEAAAGPHSEVLPELVKDGSSRVRRAAATSSR